MEQAFSIATLWFGLALVATFLAARLKISMALMEIIVGVAAAAAIGHFFGKMPWAPTCPGSSSSPVPGPCCSRSWRARSSILLS